MAPALPALAVRGAGITFGGRPLFTGIDFAIIPGERICLVGRNGTGKSTLLKALAGLIDLDAGDRFVQPGVRAAYLPQDPDLGTYATVGAYVAEGLPADLGEETYRIAAVLDPLGLPEDRPTRGLSGGEQRRAALARTLVGDPDVLLLDEPTNHLDLPTIEWLESHLKDHRGGLVLISHDRACLTALGNSLAWLDRGVLRRLDRGFADFEDWAERVEAEEARDLARLDKKIAGEAVWAVEGISARRKRNQGRLRALAAMRADRRDRIAKTGVAKLEIQEGGRGSRLVIEADGLTKRFDDRVIVDGFSTRILRGDRVGVLGPNGAGKSTLVKLLVGGIDPDAGTVRRADTLQMAVFDQTRSDLDPDASLADVLLPQGGEFIRIGDKTRHVSGYLRDFLFDPSRLGSPVRSLSGGEKNRLLLARLFARPSNLLVLDEPTNDLDLDTLDLLEAVLADYRGTLILVSHDRDFLDRLVTSVIAVEGDGDVMEYVGGYTDYRRQRAERPHRTAKAEARKAAGSATPASSKPGKAKLSFKQKFELERLPARIDALSGEIAQLADVLADTSLYTKDPKGFAAMSSRLAAAEMERAQAEERWLELAALAEEHGV